MQVATCVKCNDYQNIIGMWMTLGGSVLCKECAEKCESPTKEIKALVFGQVREKEKA